MVQERSAGILEAVIEEFIASGEPVSSGRLFHAYHFGIKPAMIRLELNKLTELGFLQQPHHSSGRIPTDRGYEFFASAAIEKEGEARVSDRQLVAYFEQKLWQDFVHELASDLELLGAASSMAQDALYKDGLENLIDHLDWGSRDEIKEVIHDIEHLDKRIEARGDSLFDREDIRIFIGKKSPITKSENLAVMIGDYEIDEGRILLVAIGPKRMDYQKAAKTFRGLKNISTHGRTSGKK